MIKSKTAISRHTKVYNSLESVQPTRYSKGRLEIQSQALQAGAGQNSQSNSGYFERFTVTKKVSYSFLVFYYGFEHVGETRDLDSVDRGQKQDLTASTAEARFESLILG